MQRRFVFLLVAPLSIAGACNGSTVEPPDAEQADAYFPSPNPIGFPCTTDAGCVSGAVCSRLETCAAPGTLTVVVAKWTITGEAPSAANCAAITNIDLAFKTSGDSEFGFTKVVCLASQFRVDKVPPTINSVTLVATQNGREKRVSAAIVGGQATLDIR